MYISDIKGTFQLHNGVDMPYFGLGVFQSKDGDEVINAIHYALDAGYRHIDTAAIYRNERGVGEAIKSSAVKRGDIFLTSKLWNGNQGYDSAKKALEASLERLGTDYLDLYLIHWPVKDKYKESWKALEEAYKKGKVRAIGVSNFLKHHLEDLLNDVEIVPMVNQMEFHPYLVQQPLLDYCKKHGIQYEAWSPIMKGKVQDVTLLNELAEKYGKNPYQIVLRWDLQKGVVTIPKSVQQDRIVNNAEIFDFSLSDEDMMQIDALDKNKRLGPDPDNFDF
jgi:diketogulonate reductase-like aldo/keto reductase